MAYDQTLVQIRERSFLDVLDLAMVVVRTRPVTIGVAALLGALPFALLDGWLIHDTEVPGTLLFVLIMFQSPLATAPLTIVLGGLMFGQRPGIWELIKTLARSAWPLFLYQCVLRAGCLITGVAYIVLPTRLAFLNEVILLERGSWKSVLRRAMARTELRGAELFAQWAVSLFTGTMFILAFWAGTGALVSALSSSELTWEPSWRDLVGARFQFALWLAIEFFAVARFIGYIDQRIRLEGWEVELRLRSAGKALQEAGRW